MVLTLAGSMVAAFCTGNLAVELLRRAHVAGFNLPDDPGSVLLATLSFHGAAIVAGILFLKFHDIGWREIAGLDTMRWHRQLLLAAFLLVAVAPVMFDLKCLSEIIISKTGGEVTYQHAVEIIASTKSPWLKGYLAFFAVVLAPVAEEFFFRGLIFSGLKKLGWPKSAWLGSSFLFAAVHFNLPVFLPLFVFALALAWLYQQTEGLLAPILAHSLFNLFNLVILFLQS